MISTTDLQAFIEKIEGGCHAVDLFKIGHANIQTAGTTSKVNKYNSNNGKFRVALDMEQCLDRFYGGYYSDWACGGQWNRALQFVQLLVNAFTSAQIEIIAFFDGTLKENKKTYYERNDFRQKTISVLKHIRMIGTPPPKIWWIPPSGIRTSLRNALRSCNIQVVQTVYDHTMEVMDYYTEHKLNGVIGMHPDYIIGNVARYFSSHDLRLSYKGALETKEFRIDQLLSNLNITPEQLIYLGVFFGNNLLMNDYILKEIYKTLNIEYNLDFEIRIKKIAEIVKNAPTTSVEEFIKFLKLDNYAKIIKELVEYYERKHAGKKFYTSKKKANNSDKVAQEKSDGNSAVPPMAAETNENDEMAKKILDDVNNLVDEANSNQINGESDAPNSITKQKAKFLYTLPGEVLRTSLNRHQRGMMDARIYLLLTKKEILLPQVLEDELFRETLSIQLFYRPARQLIYAILFNLYHQKYMCSKVYNKNKITLPEVTISEWIWSPQNDYKTPDIVHAVQLSWAVPTIQRLWFGMNFDDKHRRMRAFLTVMRSDCTLMLNRGYVPQHMLVMACVLRYIVTNPDCNVLTRTELDAFLATAFSPQLVNIEHTQDMILPAVQLRGVYLATLFMQGVETAQLANDACGVPLPWSMTNPWLFFDGKLFHLKLKMSTYVSNLRELCDDQLEIVLKIERFRKAILEDVEHMLSLPIDPMYRPGFFPPPTQLQQQQNSYKNQQNHPISNIPIVNNGYFNTPNQSILSSQTTQQQSYTKQQHNIPNYHHQSHQSQLSNQLSASGLVAQQNQQYYMNNSNTNNSNVRHVNFNLTRIKNNFDITHLHRHGGNHMSDTNVMSGHNLNNNSFNNRGYQLKVGGVVVGSWAGGSSYRGNNSRDNRNNRNRLTGRATVPETPIARTLRQRTIHNKYNKKNRKPNIKKVTTAEEKLKTKENNGAIEKKEDNGKSIIKEDSSLLDSKNGPSASASALANSICDKVLKEDSDTLETENNSSEITKEIVNSPIKSEAKEANSTKSDIDTDTIKVTNDIVENKVEVITSIKTDELSSPNNKTVDKNITKKEKECEKVIDEKGQGDVLSVTN